MWFRGGACQLHGRGWEAALVTRDVFTVGILGVGRREDEGDPYGGVGIIAIHSDASYALNENC